MQEMMTTLTHYFQFPFVRYALIVGVLVAMCSSIFGVTLVLKRYAFIGDGLSHVAFGAMAVATGLSLTNANWIVLPATIVTAIYLLKSGRKQKVKGDATLAMISVGSLAIGYLVMNLFSSSSNLSGDVCSILFGATSILTLSKTDVWLCIIMSLIVIVFFVLFYHRIFAVTFDEQFLEATGGKASRWNDMIAVIIALIIVLAMNLVGALLISAFIIFPALAAMRIFNNFKAVVISSAVISVICAVAGILISILVSTPVGSTIVAVNVVGYLICSIIGKFGRR